MKGVTGGVPKVQRVILFINPEKKQALTLADEIKREIDSLGIEHDSFSFDGKTAFVSEAVYDAAICLGGDGTVLATARAMAPRNTPIFPVNLGTFGFIAGVQPREWREVFIKWLSGKAPLSRRIMLEVRVKRDDIEIPLGCCLNDTVIKAAGTEKIIYLKVSCGENAACNEGPAYNESGPEKILELGQYRSDGLIAATPTGSTAYSAAAGGPFVDPELELLILNPICPFTLTHRPMVLPSKEMITIEVDKGQKGGALLTIDGQVTEKLKGGDRVQLRQASNYCFLIASGRRAFFDALKTKLVWAGGNLEGMQ